MGRFNLSHDHTLTMEMGELIPVATMEVLPGDMFRHMTSVLIRTESLKAPVMHPVYMRVHHFFVPNRLVDDNWEDFITTRDGRDATNPTLTLSSIASGNVADHMGIDIQVGDEILAHPIRAYNLIYNEWFRDQDLQNAVSLDSQTIKRVAWGRDYFTKARPNPQQGTAVTVPISGASGIENMYVRGTTSGTGRAVNPDGTIGATSGTESFSEVWVRRTGGGATDNVDPMLLGGGGGTLDIKDLRRALFLQQQAEQRERYGSRYVDLLKQFGVRPQDARLQRPELLGGHQRPISFSEVVATAEGTGVDVGDLYGHGMGVMSGRPYRRMFPEHGWVITLLSVIPRTQYMTMVPKQFLRANPPDYWFPEGEIEGPQPIAQREIYSAAASPTDTWGWTGRHDEYRSNFSYVSGEMRTTLDDWHYARDFSSYPALNGDFVEATPTDRVYSNTENDPLRVFVNHRISAARPVSQTPMV